MKYLDFIFLIIFSYTIVLFSCTDKQKKAEVTINKSTESLSGWWIYGEGQHIFKDEESLTLWVTADANKIPVKISANLDVGSLRADLVALRGLKHPFEIQF